MRNCVVVGMAQTDWPPRAGTCIQEELCIVVAAFVPARGEMRRVWVTRHGRACVSHQVSD
jgi:hypothetical protein